MLITMATRWVLVASWIALLGISSMKGLSAKETHIMTAQTQEELASILHRVKRVIGGSEVENGKWPWLVSLQGRIPVLTFFGIPLTKHSIYCGASLLNNRWLLTAAHCFVVLPLGDAAKVPKYWHARLGNVNLQHAFTAVADNRGNYWRTRAGRTRSTGKLGLEELGPQATEASMMDELRGVMGEVLDIPEWKNWYVHADLIIIHPNYDSNNNWANDIALVRLAEPVPSGEEVPEIGSVTITAQGERRFPADGQICIMQGWGCTESGGAISTTAQETPLPKVNDFDCSRLFGIDTRRRLCAGYNLEMKGICSGDSGGPLVCRQENTWVQVGIASFTSSERPGDVPGAFTRVSAYTDWIIKMVMKYSESNDLNS